MRKLLVASIVVVCGWAMLSMTSGAQDAKKPTIKEVMQACMKGGLCKKVASGEGSADDKKKLAEMFTALHAAKPPKGEQASWDEKTNALLAAANDVIAGKEGAGAKLQAAANCMACHSAHKGK